MTRPHAIIESLYLAGVFVSAAGLVWECCRRRMAGPVLLDCGRNTRRQVQAGAGVLMLAWGCIILFVGSPVRFQGWFYIGCGAVILLSATRRFQIRQSGVFGRRFFRWEEIEEYYLSPKGALVLKLKGKGWTRSAGSVPADEWQQANELLASRLPAQQVVFVA